MVLLRRKEAPGIACGESITQETGWHGHHVTPKVLGWPDGAANRQHIAVKLYADYSWSKTQHNGFPTNEIVMSEANSQTNGAYRLAPGYKA